MSLPQTFPVEVPDLGTFMFRKRTIRLQARIEAETLRILGGPVSDPLLYERTRGQATLESLMASPAEGFKLDDLDPLDPEDVAKIDRIMEALQAEEARFRGRAAPERPGVGPGA